MKIVFNDNGDIKFGSTRIHIHNIYQWFIELGYDAALNDWGNYEKYEVAIFGKNVSIHEILKAKKQNKKLLCGQVNPSDYTTDKIKSFNIADFFIVGSIPELEYYRQYSDNIFLFPQIERMFTKYKNHLNNESIIMGYHGNKDHLLHFEPYLKKALEILGSEIKIKLIVCYDRKNLGEWTIGRPNIEVEEIQWESDTIEENLLKCDIGLVPGLTTIYQKENNLLIKLFDWFCEKRGGYKNDYFLRFKNTTNSGRAFVFHQLGIPVVGDFCPPNFHILATPECGYLAHFTEGWLHALRELSRSAEKRNKIAQNAFNEFCRLYNPLDWNRRLHEQIKNLYVEKKSES